MADMKELIARLEAAEAGSAELDEAVAIGCGSKTQGWAEWASDGTFLGSIRPYTTSLDVALALAERVLPGCCPGVAKNVHHQDWYAWIGDKEEDGPLDLGNARSGAPALALCIAILKAKAQGWGGHG